MYACRSCLRSSTIFFTMMLSTCQSSCPQGLGRWRALCLTSPSRSLLHSFKAYNLSRHPESGLGLLRESFLGEKDFQTILKKERKLVFWREAWSAQTNLEQGQNRADTLGAQAVSPSDPTISVPAGCSRTTESCLVHPHSAGWMCWGD